MNVAALVMYLVFGVVGFGWRTWLQWRRTGDTGLRMHAQTGSLQWWAKLGFVAALAAGVAAPGVGLLGLDPIRALDAAPVQVAGVALGVVGRQPITWGRRSRPHLALSRSECRLDPERPCPARAAPIRRPGCA